MTFPPKALVSRNVLKVAAVLALILFVCGYGYSYGLHLALIGQQNDNGMGVDEHGISAIPDDTVLYNLDDDAVYQTFWKYVRTTQFKCQNLTRLGPPGDKGKNICSDKLYTPKASSCLVYSFGSNFNFKFEDAVWKQYRCEIHTFDPSLSLEGAKIPPYVNFHLTGLSGNNFVKSTPEPWRLTNQKQQPKWNMQTLATIKKSLNHTDKVIDVLKIDIEGWEWQSLTEIMESGVLKYVKQICLELHFGYGFKPVFKNGRAVTVEFTSDKWGNTALPDQLKVLRDLYQHGFQIFMHDPIRGWAIRHIKNPDRDINTLVEISVVNTAFKPKQLVGR